MSEMSGAVKAAIVVIAILIVVIASYTFLVNTNILGGVQTTSYQIPSELTTNFSRNFTFVSSQSFTFFLTPTITDSLQQTDITFSHSPNVNATNEYSQNRSYWKFLIGAGRSYIDVKYNVSSVGKSWQSLESSTGLPSQIPEALKTQYDHPEFFNSSGTNLEVIDPAFFSNLTHNITWNETTVAGKLKSIYDYIVRNYRYNITYNLGNIPLSARQVYQLKEGDCEELSYLFESMSRSIGIPSWTQYGILLQQVNGQISMGEHAWVQTYVPTPNGSGVFVNIDLTVEVGGKDLGRGFFVKYPNALVEWTDNGNSSAMVAYHTEIVAYSGIDLVQQENDTVYSFNQSGEIQLVQDNIFNLFVANISRESE